MTPTATEEGTMTENVVRWCRATAALAGTLVGLLAVTGVARAQNAVITGQVTSEVGEPLEGANVFITEMNIAAGTNAAGRYTIAVPAARAAGQSVTLRV